MIDIPPFNLAQARKSALVVATVFAGIAAWQFYRGRPTAAAIFAGLSALLLLCSAIPIAAMTFHKYWMTLAAILGYVNSRILLSIMFYAVMTPIGLIMRTIGHDALQRRSGVEPSYWRARPTTRQPKEQYERSF